MTLTDFQTPDGYFTIAPFDHRNSLAQSLHLNLTRPEHRQKFQDLKSLFMEILSKHTSAVLTDPEFGLSTLDKKAANCGLFLSLEASGYSGNHDAMTDLLPNWGIDGVKRNSAGAKLLVYLNSDSDTYTQKIELVKKLSEEARQKNVIFLVEPVVYDHPTDKKWSADTNEEWIAMHLEICQAIAPYCDILKIQYPGNREACDQIFGLHKNWILLSRGVGFDEFAGYLTLAARSGAKGYAAGRAVWKEIEQWSDVAAWRSFLETTAVERLEKLTQILRSSRWIT